MCCCEGKSAAVRRASPLLAVDWVALAMFCSRTAAGYCSGTAWLGAGLIVKGSAAYDDDPYLSLDRAHHDRSPLPLDSGNSPEWDCSRTTLVQPHGINLAPKPQSYSIRPSNKSES